MYDAIEDLLREAYSATHHMLNDPELGSVVRHGLVISYGPPIPEPDLLLLSFQGAGNTDASVNDTWPEKLRSLDSPSRFNRTLRGLCCETGLYSSLQSSAMAFPAVFPQAPSKEARRWMNKTGPRAKWRRHSAYWVKRLVKATKPKVIIVFGEKASKVLDIHWDRVERNHRGHRRTFGVSEFQGAPAVFCAHLSQGYVRSGALKCFRYAKELISERS